MRSIAVRTDRVSVPDLSNPEQIRSGAGNYDAMCAQCHLAPGMTETELHRGLLPTPPNLAEHRIADPAKAFWVVKHGIKFTGRHADGHVEESRSPRTNDEGAPASRPSGKPASSPHNHEREHATSTREPLKKLRHIG